MKKYEVVNGKLVIKGSLADYGFFVNPDAICAICPCDVNAGVMNASLNDDSYVRQVFRETGKLPYSMRGIELKVIKSQ